MSRSATTGFAALTAAALALTLAACGGGETADESGAQPVTPTTIPIPDDIVLDGEPRPLFGSSASGDVESADEATSVEAEAIGPDEPGSAVDPCRAEVDPDDPLCRGVPDVADPDTDADFSPAAADAPFCTVLSNIEQRRWPTDEFDQLRVTQIWLAELEAVVPDTIAGDLGRLTNFVDQVVDAGERALPDIEFDPTLESAADRIGDYVDTNCSGR